MRKNIIYLIIIYSSIFGQIYSQDYPRIKSAKIDCSVIFSNSAKLYFYKYIVKNDINSTGELFSFEMDGSLVQGIIVDSVGLLFKDDLNRSFFQMSYEDLKNKVVPMGVSNTPDGWDGSLSEQCKLHFSGFPEIKPGETLNNFEINSFGLPSIRKVVFSIAKDTVIDSWPSIEDTTSTLSFEQMDSILASLDYSSWTVAPNFFPKDISFMSIVDTINSYIQQSFQLSWIKNQLTADKYANYFNTAKTQLQQNNITGVRTTLNNVLRDVDQDSTSNLTSEAYALIKYNTEYLLANLPAPTNSGLAVKIVTSTNNLLTTGSLQYYDGGWKDAVNNNDGTFSVNTTLKTVSLRMTYEGGTQTLSNVAVGSDTAVFRTVNTSVHIKDSHGNAVDTGKVQYYAGAWRDFGTTSNGITTKELLPNTYSFRMTYAFASNDKQQNIGTDPNVVFQTVNAAVQLKNSLGTLIDQGTVQYYAGAWRDFGATTNGVANKELLPNNYSFRMTYAYASNDKQQNIGTDPNVVFQTVNAAVQLKNSSGTLMDQGTVQYYAGAWRDLGTTTNGVANKELLPNTYSFRMTYAYASNDKQQNIGTDPNVVFQTVNAAVQLKNSSGALIDQGTVQYYAGAWRDFGTTTNGVANKELLPNNYSFRMTYAFASNDKQQNIGTYPNVIFQTVNAAVQLKNSSGAFIDQGTVQYYAGAWRDFGTTTNGVANKELLPNTYSFRMTYAFASNDKQQNIGTDPNIVFQTVNAAVHLKNSSGTLIDPGTVQYYSGAWRDFGTTTNGVANKELLPNNYSFRMTYGYVSKDIAQNIGTSNVVNFSTVLCTISVNNLQGQPVSNADAKYYSGAWREIGLTSGGIITKELLPASLTFRINYGTTQQDKTQDISTNGNIGFILP